MLRSLHWLRGFKNICPKEVVRVCLKNIAEFIEKFYHLVKIIGQIFVSEHYCDL